MVTWPCSCRARCSSSATARSSLVSHLKASGDAQYSGDYGCGFFGTSYNDDPETKATKLNAELANGRLAMLGIAGAMFAEGQTGETLAQQFENLSFSIV